MTNHRDGCYPHSPLVTMLRQPLFTTLSNFFGRCLIRGICLDLKLTPRYFCDSPIRMKWCQSTKGQCLAWREDATDSRPRSKLLDARSWTSGVSAKIPTRSNLVGNLECHRKTDLPACS